MAQYTQFANSIYRILLKNLIGITGIMGKKKIENRYPILSHSKTTEEQSKEMNNTYRCSHLDKDAINVARRKVDKLSEDYEKIYEKIYGKTYGCEIHSVSYYILAKLRVDKLKSAEFSMRLFSLFNFITLILMGSLSKVSLKSYVFATNL